MRTVYSKQIAQFAKQVLLRRKGIINSYVLLVVVHPPKISTRASSSSKNICLHCNTRSVFQKWTFDKRNFEIL